MKASFCILIILFILIDAKAQWPTLGTDIEFISNSHNNPHPNYGFNLESADSNQERFILNNTDGVNQQVFYFGHANSALNIFGISTSGNSGSDWLPRFVINQNGRIGIGTNNPLAKLHVEGNQEINGSLRLYSPNYIHLKIERDNGGYATVGVTSGTTQAFLSSGGSLKFLTGGLITPKMFIKEDGNVGIGTTIPDSKLTVNGTIHSQEVKVTVNAGADYVFEEDYELSSLKELAQFIKQFKHLPEVPPASAMEKDGIELSKMNILLLKKIEELTLYTIKQEEYLESQKVIVEQQNKLLNNLLLRIEILEKDEE